MEGVAPQAALRHAEAQLPQRTRTKNGQHKLKAQGKKPSAPALPLHTTHTPPRRYVKSKESRHVRTCPSRSRIMVMTSSGSRTSPTSVPRELTSALAVPLVSALEDWWDSVTCEHGLMGGGGWFREMNESNRVCGWG